MLENLFSFIEVFIALSFASSISKLFRKVQEIFSSFVFDIGNARQVTLEEEDRLEKFFTANEVVLSPSIDEDNIPRMILNKKEISNLKKSRNKNWDNLDKKVKSRSETIFFNRIALSNALVGILLLLLIPNYIHNTNSANFRCIIFVSLFQFSLATISFVFDFNTKTKSIAQKTEEWIKISLNIDTRLLFFIFIVISILISIGTTYFTNIGSSVFCNENFFLSISIIIALLAPFIYYILRAIFVILSNKTKFNKTKKENRYILHKIEQKLDERQNYRTFTKEVEEAIVQATRS